MTERIQKDLIVSNEVHSHLFSVKAFLYEHTGKNYTLNEVVEYLFERWQCGGREAVDLDYNHEEMKKAIEGADKKFKLEEKE